MEKPSSSKSKSNILFRLLPRAAKASVSFQNPHFSPGRDKRANGTSSKLKSHLYRAFSGPIISMIPAEAREESKNFETQEPNSPKISCMGQIKHKKNIFQKQHASLPTDFKPVLLSQPEKLSKSLLVGPAAELKKKKPPSGNKKILNDRRKSDASINHGKPPLPDRAPCLSQTIRFASSRDTFAYFDWTTDTAGSGGGDYYSGEDWGSYSDGDDDAGIAFSAPLLVAGAEAEAGTGGGLVLEPKKEINLWKRRTMARPKPLQLNVNC